MESLSPLPPPPPRASPPLSLGYLSKDAVAEGAHPVQGQCQDMGEMAKSLGMGQAAGLK